MGSWAGSSQFCTKFSIVTFLTVILSFFDFFQFKVFICFANYHLSIHTTTLIDPSDDYVASDVNNEGHELRKHN